MGSPHDTLSDVFGRLKPSELEAGFQRWVSSLAAAMSASQIPIDGKVIRVSGDSQRGKPALHMVSAWMGSAQLLLGQVKTEAKSNEITAIPELLKLLVVEGCLVTLDAMGMQIEIAAQIVDQGGDYLLAVKGNHKTVLHDLEDLFAGCDEVQFAAVPHDYAHTIEKGHGRIDIRRCWTLSDPAYLAYLHRHSDWKALTTVVRITREHRIGDKKTEDNGYAERLIRTIKEEEVDLSEYADFHHAYQRIGRFLEDVYTHKRIHSALGYLTPAEFEANWLMRQPEPVLE